MGIYKSFEESKNGTLIPVFTSGKTMESRYNPQRDAENLLGSINQDCNFFIILGLGSGLFIEMLSNKCPDAKIIVLELYKEDIEFLKQSESVQKLLRNPKVCITPLDSLEQTLTQNYLPAKYGNLNIIEQRAWINENSAHIEKINSIIKKTLGIISADYSVQSHFGKLWNSNILNNASLAEKINCSTENIISEKDKNKTAVIVAAGPTLDKTISLFKEAPEKHFIIATDTAGQSLLKHNIIPDIIVSIDGQAVSYNHFIRESGQTDKTIYAFDLCANSSAARYIHDSGNKVSFFCSGHPLSSAINSISGNPLPVYFSGAGTVTITALDMAIQNGFKEILILGADFSYSNGKAYAEGTYLDALYNKASSKIMHTEGAFSKLMFRTPLTDVAENVKTNQILDAYRVSLETYLTQKDVSFIKENDIYKLHCNGTAQVMNKPNVNSNGISLKLFMSRFINSTPEEAEPLLLPYIAWLRNNEKYSHMNYDELVKLAFNSIVSYNI